MMEQAKRIELGNTREVCWDLYLAETLEGVTLRMHKPVRKNIVMTCDKPWEGCTTGYLELVKVGDVFRMYYRCGNDFVGEAAKREEEKEEKEGPDFTGSSNKYGGSICMAESRDGKTFTRPKICKFDFFGEKENNIIFRDEKDFIDNCSIFYDENPACPPEEKFKAFAYKIGDDMTNFLDYYRSPDGIDFTFDHVMPVHGKFDSFNIIFWDKKTEQYFFYYRDYHKADGGPTTCKNVDLVYDIRDIRVATSKDFITWEEHGQIDFGPDAEDIPLYTSNITKYFRSENMFWGLPVRYCDRREDEQNFKDLTLPGFDRYASLEKVGREVSALTDAVLITSRDGFRFNRTDEAFRTPGPENGSNWIYGDCYHAYGAIETESDFPGEANEISLYAGHGYRTRPLDIVRYTLRLDGFYSWHADYCGGRVLTKPITFSGETLSINFETSVRGYVQILVCDEAGEPIPGYDSGRLFGNSVDRTVRFEKDLSQLAGKSVRLRIEMKDSELYSFIFN
ncbi:MAG: hypothetical protein E7414_03695 [Ruminococcaceae bacterium]|nr:hypothetical protein [Oscillospiraceae bacterium]